MPTTPKIRPHTRTAEEQTAEAIRAAVEEVASDHPRPNMPQEWLVMPERPDLPPDERPVDARAALVGGQKLTRFHAAVDDAVEGIVTARHNRLPPQLGKRGTEIMLHHGEQQAREVGIKAVVEALEPIIRDAAEAKSKLQVAGNTPLTQDEHPSARGFNSDKPASTADLFAVMASLRALEREADRLVGLDCIQVPGEINRAVREKRWETVLALDLGGALARMAHTGGDIMKAVEAARLTFRKSLYDAHNDRARLTYDGFNAAVDWLKQQVQVADARLFHRSTRPKRTPLDLVMSKHLPQPGDELLLRQPETES